MSSIQRCVKEAAWVVLAATVLAAAAFAFRSLLIIPGDVAMSTAGAALPGDRVPDMTFADAVDHFNAGTAVFADARSEAAYKAGHIRGAVHLPPQQFEFWSEKVIAQIDANAVIITYCDGERCTLGVELAEKFTWLGYEHVYCLKDGWSRWTAAQMPIEAGVR